MCAENGVYKPTWVSSVPISTRRVRLRSLLAGCIFCCRCHLIRRYHMQSCFLSSCPALYKMLLLKLRNGYVLIQRQNDGKIRLEWFTDASLCIFISSQLDASSSSFFLDHRSDRECRDEHESGENITSSLDKLGLVNTRGKVWAGNLRSGAKQWCWTGCDTDWSGKFKKRIQRDMSSARAAWEAEWRARTWSAITVGHEISVRVRNSAVHSRSAKVH